MALVELGVWEYQLRLARLNRGESFFPTPRSPAAIIAELLALPGIAIAAYLVLVARWLLGISLSLHVSMIAMSFSAGALP